MTQLARLISWLRSVNSRARVESNMEEELRFHIQSYAEDLCRKGVPPAEANRRARLEFGAVEAHKEECRASLGLRLWDEIFADLSGGIRFLRQSPLFTAVAVVSLALGIGANTAIFTLANEVLLRTMAVPHSERLRLFTWAHGPNAHMGPLWGSFGKNDLGESTGSPFPYPLYQAMRAQNSAAENPVMEDLVAFKDVYRLSATIAGEAEAVDGILVSGNFYPALGARVEAGRAITAEDNTPSAAPVVVISDAFWARRFGRSANALGKTIELNRVPVTIIGVNAPEFAGPKAGGAPEVFFPLGLQQQVIPHPAGSLLARNDYWWVVIMGRIKPGVTDQATAKALTVEFRNAFHATQPEKQDKDMPRFVLEPGARGLDMRQSFRQPIYLLMALAGLVLLIACANLANLLLARSTTRQREIGLRLAMGAGRLRIMRQILTESLLLSFLGGAAGLLLGYVGRNVIPNLFAGSWRPSELAVQMDWRIFGFAFAVSLATGLLFGLAPAWRSTQADANAALKDSVRMSNSRPKALFGKGLVVFQVALSLLLLVGAGLFLRTLINLRTADTGIKPEHILLFQLQPPRYPAPKMIALFQAIEQNLAALPGVQMSTLSSEPLLANNSDDDCFRPTGRPPRTREQDQAWRNNVGANFFETFGIPIVSGRALTRADNQTAPKVAVINRQLAKEFFPDRNPVGQTISPCGAATPIEVVGVSADTKYSDIRQAPPGTIYIPYLQADDLMFMTFELKTAASRESLMPRIRAAVRAVDKDLPLLDVRTQTEQIEDTLSQERVFAILTSGFGVLALILAGIGIYGVMAYTVSRRTNEIGIRMALGAQASSVLAMVLAETSVLAGAGTLAGLCAAFGAGRLVASMLFEVKPADPLTLAAAASALLAVALLACLSPAWRAATVDPMTALRHD